MGKIKDLEGKIDHSKGFKPFIEGLIEYIERLMPNKSEEDTKRAIDYHFVLMKECLDDAKEKHGVSEEELKPLRIKYNLLKTSYESK